MKKIFVFVTSLLFISVGILAFAVDHLFLHNNDSITLQNTMGDPVEFQIYSISNKSRIFYTGPGCGETITVTNAEGWVTKVCSGGFVTITVLEAGNKNDDSDVVIRYGSGVKESNVKHADDSKKGSKCSTCGKTLIW
ncbi:MAG: hypothetical protein WBK20_09930 [Spirochaetota bacterium]